MINYEYILIPRSTFESLLKGATLTQGQIVECQSVLLASPLPTPDCLPLPSQNMVLPEKLQAVLNAAQVQSYTPYQQKVHAFFSNLDPALITGWRSAFPGNVDLELCKMYAWLMSNTNKAKKNLRAFCNGWINRGASNTAPRQSQPISGGTSRREL